MQSENSKKAYIIPIFKTVVFPGMDVKVNVDKSLGYKIKKHINDSKKHAVALSLKEEAEKHKLRKDNFYKTGTLLEIISISENVKGFQLDIKGLEKVSIEKIQVDDKLFTCKYTILEEIVDISELEQKQILSQIKETIKEISKRFQGSEQFLFLIEKIKNLDDIIDTALPYMKVTIKDRQELLESKYLKERYLKFIELLVKQKELIDLNIEMAQKASEKTNKQYREALLKEQLKAIQEELNKGGGGSENKEDYRERVETSDMPDDTKKIALAEVNKLETGGPHNSEAHVIRNYLDLLLELPWKKEEAKEIDIKEARNILNEDHYGLEEVKDRIIQHLAVLKLKKEKQGSILLLTGPPGTGKTSLGKSIARALDRKYIRLSLGGIRDEAEIRGHRRTYVGALPGRIINGIKKAGTKNPVFILDEIDKLMVGYSGDPASALLEVLDPEQNNTFSDHYLDVPYDLSDVFFIATANSTSTISPPLLDRMESIEISSYTNNEKFHIGKDHLVPEVLEEHGLDSEKLAIDDEAIKQIIDKYTREAGVRGLKKQITKIARVASEHIVSETTDLPYYVTREMLNDVLGREMIRLEEINKDVIPGVATGLAWTPVGGEILFIETTHMKGKGSLILTGQLGDVMKESARISLSLICSRLSHLITEFEFSKNDIHIHVPAGATPKDGPSAGITLFTALVSLFAGKIIDPKFAMTGEITLSGKILPIGGIKEKVLAAHRSGVTHIILPLENEKDLKDVPDDVKRDLHFIPVESIDEVVYETLGIELQKPELFFLESCFNQVNNSLSI